MHGVWGVCNDIETKKGNLFPFNDSMKIHFVMI